MIRIRRQGLSSKLFSLIGGVTTGLVVTMAVVIPMPGRRIEVPAAHTDRTHASAIVRSKETFSSDVPAAIDRNDEMPVPAVRQEQPVLITPSPVATLRIETVLPDQTGRNIALQQQTSPLEPNRVTHQLAQAWEPGMAYSPRYLPHTSQGGSPRRPDTGQPGITGRDGRNPRPPEGPEPASHGN